MNCISDRPCEECEYGHCKSNWDDCEEWECNMPDDLNEAVGALLQAFPKSFINERGEFIAHLRTNQYIILNNCKTPLDIECKVLEWFSRPSCKTQPYSQEWRNRKFHEFMRNGVNAFLDTSFSEDEMFIIYDKLGNCINHKKTIDFIESDYDFSLLTLHLRSNPYEHKINHQETTKSLNTKRHYIQNQHLPILQPGAKPHDNRI